MATKKKPAKKAAKHVKKAAKKAAPKKAAPKKAVKKAAHKKAVKKAAPKKAAPKKAAPKKAAPKKAAPKKAAPKKAAPKKAAPIVKTAPPAPPAAPPAQPPAPEPICCDAQRTCYSKSVSIVNSSWGCDTPRRAYRPADTRRRLMSPTSANAADIRTGWSTERHITAMRLASFTAGPRTVKSSRSRLPTLP